MTVAFTTLAHNKISNVRVRDIRPLMPPQILHEELPLSLKAANTVVEARMAIEHILKGDDDRLMVVVGPCSIHNIDAARDYAQRLKAYADEAKEDLLIVMRVSFERPRRTPNWRGFINDPDMNGTSQINKGLHLARSFLLELAVMGLPAGCEWLDVVIPQYTGDLVSWGAIGARATESQVHRELVSGLPMPIGFKNSTDGTVGVALDACKAAQSGHCFLTVGAQGLSSIVETEGNPDIHIILRGGIKGPNYEEKEVDDAVAKLKKSGLKTLVMVDASHGNGPKDYELQVGVAANIATQLRSTESGKNIMGIMLESNLVAGRQDIPASGKAGLIYGQSITEACLSWETTVQVLDDLRDAVRVRRSARK